MSSGCACRFGIDRQESAKNRGHALVEWLIAVPVVLLIGLAILQWSLVWQARHSLEYAALKGARAAAMEHGHAAGLEQGLSEGLGPLWGLADQVSQKQELGKGLAAGWIAWRRMWPPSTVFADFAEAARDASGRPIRGQREIPNDNLRFRPSTPGAASGLSLAQANQIEVRVTYGVPLVVPMISSLIVRVMEVIDGCADSERLQLVVTDLNQGVLGDSPRSGMCIYYRAPASPGGRPVLRIPIQVAASSHMHSALRVSARVRSAAGGAEPLPTEQRVGPNRPLTAPDRELTRDGSSDLAGNAPGPDDFSSSPGPTTGLRPPGHEEPEAYCPVT